MAVNITTDTNTVKVTSTSTNNVKIVDNGNNTSVTVSQPTTRVIKVATVGPQGPTGAIPNTGSFATTGSNTFIGAQTITGSNGRLIYRGTTSGVYPTNTLAEIHANDDYPWLERFYNDTFSTSSAIMAYFGWSDGRFVFHNESTQSIGLQVNGFGAENGLLVYSDKVAFVNNVVVTGSLNVSGSITGSLFGTASHALTASYALNGGGTVDTSGLATTGSNTFVGNQIISGAVNVTGLLTVQNAIVTPSGQYFVASSDTSTEMSWSVPFAPSIAVSSGIGTGPSGTSIANISTDSNGDALPIKYWNFNMDGTTTVPGNLTGAANLATTGSNTFIGNQTISGSLRVSGSISGGGIVTSSNVSTIQTITSASYAGITPVSGTLYIIIG